LKIIIDGPSANAWLLELKNVSVDEVEVSEQIRLASDIAKKYIGNHLPNIKDELKYGSGYILIKGVPIDLETSGVDPRLETKIECPSISELSLLGITAASGLRPFSYAQEKMGSLVHEVVPKPDCGNSVSSDGFVEFKLHADGAYLNRAIRPETLSLMCLNNDAQTKTNLILIDDVVHGMSRNDVDILSSLNYMHVSPETFGFGVKSKKIKSSIIDRVDGSWEVKVATHNTEPCGFEAESALTRFIHMANSKVNAISWEPGDFVIFSNLRCLHGRGSISGRRWLKRCYGSRNMVCGSVVDLNDSVV